MQPSPTAQLFVFTTDGVRRFVPQVLHLDRAQVQEEGLQTFDLMPLALWWMKGDTGMDTGMRIMGVIVFHG